MPFLAFFLIQIVHHQMWRDELNAFAIALASPSFGQLLHYVHYEGHPWLWYALLWLVSKIVPTPAGMKALEAVIGVGVYLVIGLASPFSRIQKILLFFCYFVSFEYTVLSRMYGLMLLVALLYIRRRALYPERVVGNAVLLGLLASTDMMGVLLSFALWLEFLFSDAARRMWSKECAFARRRFVSAVAVFITLLALSVGSSIPYRDISTRTTGRMFAYATNPTHVATVVADYTVLPYFPTVRPEALETHGRIFEALVPLVIAAYWIIFRRRNNLLLLMGGALGMTFCFGDLIYLGWIRHFGITFLAFLAGIWLIRNRGDRLHWAAYVLLILTGVAGIEMAVSSWKQPFSNVEATAGWLKEHHLEAVPLAGTPDGSAAAVAEILRKPIFMLDCNCRDTFVLFSGRRDRFSESDIPARLLSARESLRADAFVYLQASPLKAEQLREINAEGFTVQPLSQFKGARTQSENFYVYMLNFRPSLRGLHTS